MPKIGSVHKSSIQYGDVSEETSSVEIFNQPITALTIGSFLTGLGDFEDATDAITIGTHRQTRWVGDLTTLTNAWPTDRAAHRENKLLVDYWDTTTEKLYQLTIPTINFSKLNFIPGGGDNVAFTSPAASAEIIAWVAAFNSFGRSPDDDTHNVAVRGMRYVGRNT